MRRMRKIVICLVAVALICSLGICVSAATKQVETVNFTDATVNTESLNMRQGPGTSMPVVAKLQKSQAVQVLGKTGDWYFVFDAQSGKVGCVHGKYITPVNGDTVDDTKLPADGGVSEENPSTENISVLSDDEKNILELVNSARVAAGAGKVTYSEELAKVAMDKARDMVENGYFSHQSKIYGTPFEMMRSYGISFKAAAENIAGNQTVERAFYSWMASDSHKENIVNPDYDEMGVGVCISPIYGKVIVQMFIKN